MKGIHPAYESFMEDPEDESLVSRTRLLPATTSNVSYLRPPVQMKARRQVQKSNLSSPVIIIGFFFAALSGGMLVNKASDFVSRVNITLLPAVSATVAPPIQPTPKNEVEIIKKILVGLVPAVEELRKDLNATKEKINSVSPTDLDGAYEYNKSVRVVSDKAYIREAPSKDSKSLVAIAKDTVLFADSRNGDWVEVNLPIGGKGYIHKSTVEEMGEQGAQTSKTPKVVKSESEKISAQ